MTTDLGSSAYTSVSAQLFAKLTPALLNATIHNPLPTCFVHTGLPAGGHYAFSQQHESHSEKSIPGEKICSTDFYGRDLPAFRPEDTTVLVNKEPKTYAASCGGRHSKTKRLCGCGFRCVCVCLCMYIPIFTLCVNLSVLMYAASCR